MDNHKASLIISFYKEIEILKMIIAALERQSEPDFEIIIADDGSPEEITDQIKAIIHASSMKISHIWHEDNGFRKTIILNEAIRKSNSDYLIFIDGDCVPHHRFIEAHLNERQIGVVLAGRRVNLSSKLTTKLNDKKIREGYLEQSFNWSLLTDGLVGETTHVEKGFYINISAIRNLLNRKDAGLLGCNQSLYKRDILNINGFDERYLAPGIGEDTDIELRLRWNGVKVKTIKNSAVQYHLYHKPSDRPSQNNEIYNEVMRQHVIFTPYGIMKKQSP